MQYCVGQSHHKLGPTFPKEHRKNEDVHAQKLEVRVGLILNESSLMEYHITMNLIS